MRDPARSRSIEAPRATVLVRLAVGAVFLSEGVQKFLDPAELGAGRFARIGIPWPELTGPFVGIVEMVCGALVLVGLGTRVAAIVLSVVMLVAIVATKLPILLGHGFWGFAGPSTRRTGFFAMAHEARTDFAMLLGCAFLAIAGAGPWSIDALLFRRPGGRE
ncbi:MAG TPA: DoxX family protein [Sandaracinaceae bacterium]